MPRSIDYAGKGKRAYVSACVLLALTVLLRLYMNQAIAAKFPFAPFLAAVLVAAWQLGAGPSYFVLLAGGAAAIWFGTGIGTFRIDHPLTWIGLLIYLALGWGIIALMQRYVDAMSQARASEDRLNAGLEAADAATWDMDLQAGTTYWSTGHYLLLGYKVGEVEPSLEAWRARVHPDDIVMVERRWDECVAARKAYDCQFRVVWPDGKVRWVEAKGHYEFGAKGEVLRSVGGFIDITERKQAHAALLEAEKLAASGRMAAALAHEVNNPLAAVTNLLYLLRTDSQLGSEARQYLQLMDAEVSRLSKLVKRTLSFYREQSHPAVIDLGEVADGIVLLHNEVLKGTGVQVQVRNELQTGFLCHASEIRQVLTNLILNAVEAVGPGGKVVVRLRRSRDWSRSGLRGVRLLVADNGPGIADKDRARIFEPFFTTKGERGTGLGLWISKGLVEKNNGKLRIKSFQGMRSGTSVSVFLPDLAEPEQSASAAQLN